MTNQELNAALYEKMLAEQENYRKWLLGQPAEDILKHTCKYTVLEDILMSLEYHDLTDKQAAALLKSPTPLEDVFQEFERQETDYMDTLLRSMVHRANALIASETEQNTIIFGAYAGRPIQWIVLEKKDQKALLLSKYCLLKKAYHDAFTPVTWADCTLRKWLNHEFYHDVFTPDEKKKILTTKLRNAKNPLYETEGGDDTEDKVFLLSINEANKYFSSNEEGQAFFPDGKSVWWWLRSPGSLGNTAAGMFSNGSISQGGYSVDSKDGVRPALWVDLSKFHF